MIRHLKWIGSKVFLLGAEVVWWVRLLWYLTFLFFFAVLVIDTLSIKIYSVNNSHEYAPEKTLWTKQTPEEEQRLKAQQERCLHIYHTNGLYHYYCPVCRKKLTTAEAPLVPLYGTIVRQTPAEFASYKRKEVWG
jgi:hypothetical protein